MGQIKGNELFKDYYERVCQFTIDQKPLKVANTAKINAVSLVVMRGHRKRLPIQTVLFVSYLYRRKHSFEISKR